MAQQTRLGAVVAALRIGVIGGLLSGALSLADPIIGGTLSRAGTGFSDPGASSIAQNLQMALLIAGMIIYIAAGVLAARKSRSIGLGLLGGLVAGLVGALVGALINIGASYVATDAEVNYLVALGGDVSFDMGQAGATGTAIFYGIVGLVFGIVQGMVSGFIGGVAGRFVVVGRKEPVSVET